MVASAIDKTMVASAIDNGAVKQDAKHGGHPNLVDV
jgi:hypothetical protein